MRSVRPAFAADPRSFGRGFVREDEAAVPVRRYSDDVRLFATTFAAGFLFVTVFLA